MKIFKSLSLALGYFTYYGVLSLQFTYFPTYFLQVLKFSGAELGMIYSGIPVIGLIAHPFWGQVADNTHKTGKIIRWCSFLSLLTLLPLCLFQNFWTIAACFWMLSFFRSALPSLLDTLTITEFGMQKYSNIRMGGSAGYGFFAFLFPLFFTVNKIVPVLLGSLFLSWISTIFIGEEQGRASKEKNPVYFFSLIKIPAFVILISFSFFHWLSNMPYHLILDDHQSYMYVIKVTGYAVGIGIIAECLVMASAYKWLTKASPRFWLILAASITAFRWALMSYPMEKGLFVALQLLHGFSFAVFFLTSVSYLMSFVPEYMRASGQAIFSGITFSGGTFLGALYTGFLLDLPGKGFLVFGVSAILSLLSVVLALWIGKGDSMKKE